MTNPTTKSSAVDWATVLRALAGGGLAGLGIGATTTALNHLNTLKEKADMANNPPGDDNVIYLNIRRPGMQPRRGVKMAASANNAWTFALSGLGGLAGMYGAYDLVHGMHQKLRKKQLQKELDSAQQIYLDRLGQSGSFAKAAGQFSLLTKGIGSAYLTAMLAALGSGVVANRIMQKQFPSIKDPMRERPKKIVLRTVGPSGAPEGEDSVSNLPDSSPEAVESLLRTQMGNKRAAMDSGFAGLVDMAASGKCDDIRDTLLREGDDNLEYLMKRADSFYMEKNSGLNRNLAVSWLAHDPLVSSAVSPLLAAEFMDWAPGICKWAGLIDAADREVGDALVGITEHITRTMRANSYSKVLGHVKEANHDSLPGPLKAVFLAEGLKNMLAANQNNDVSAEIPISSGTVSQSEDSPSMEGIRMEVSDPEAENFYRKNHSTIDNAVTRYS